MTVKTKSARPLWKKSVCAILLGSVLSSPLNSQSLQNPDPAQKTTKTESKTETEKQPDAAKTSGIDISQKTPLSERELKKKKEGGYITGIAGPGSSPDSGFGGSAILLYYYNGKKDDPLFQYTPYLHNVGLLVSYMSRGFLQLAALYDAPYFLRTPFRLSVEVWHTLNPVAQYYGISSMGNLQHPNGTFYEKMEDYDSDLRTINNGTTYSHYNYYDMQDTLGKITVQRDFFGGRARILGGINIDYVQVRDYSQKNVIVTQNDGSEKEARMLTTKLKEDSLANKILGFQGGWNNSVLLGLAYDTRDLEPYPHKGVFHDLTFMHTTRGLGSQYDWNEVTGALRFYYTPFPPFDMVVAARVSYTARFGDVPFYGMTGIRYTDKTSTSMGGMRGYRDRRFMGPFVSLANLELRYRFAQLKPGDEIFEFALAPFIDAGGATNTAEQTSLSGWAISYGAGLRIIWNQATVFVLDFGFSKEDFGFYMQVRQIF